MTKSKSSSNVRHSKLVHSKSEPSAKAVTTGSGVRLFQSTGLLFAAVAAAILATYLSAYYYQGVGLASNGTAAAVLALSNVKLFKPALHQLDCSPSYLAELKKLRPACLPSKCGRFIDDSLIADSDIRSLLGLAERGFALGGGAGGATILDLHSGALSLGDKFVNVYALKNEQGGRGFVPTDAERSVYASAVNRIRLAVAAAFNVTQPDSLRLTRPTFFSRLTAAEARTPHDEYWHSHVDKNTYGSFHYTSLLYLANYGSDFSGGRFVFIDNNGSAMAFVEPRSGRVSAFTSGSENTHRVERVVSGVRVALTIAFTCDEAAAIDPSRMGSG